MADCGDGGGGKGTADRTGQPRGGADRLVQGDEAAVFRDRAYDSGPRREALAEAGIVDGIMHRGQVRKGCHLHLLCTAMTFRRAERRLP